MAALVALSAMAVPSIAAAKKPTKVKETYLALGDSLAFGYSQQLFNENEKDGENPVNFEHGYANDYFDLVNPGGKIQLINDGCPGETSASLIGDGPELAKLQEKQPGVTGEAPCAYHYADGLPLHNEYGGTESQLESALETLKAAKAAGKPVKAITLDIGANDQLHLIARIEKEVNKRQEDKVIGIATVEAEQAVAKHVEEIALEEIKQYVIEKVAPQAYEESGGEEPAFSEDVEKDAKVYQEEHAQELAEMLIPDEETYAHEHESELAAEGKKDGERFAYEYEQEHGAELKKEGEEVAKAEIEAEAPALFAQIVTNVKAIVSAFETGGFSGKFIFVGTYNPYGNVYGSGEVLAGSNALLKALSSDEQSSLKKKPSKACFVDEQALFNTETEPTEQEHLDQWTNMDNFTKFEGKANGPDIHATPLGYEEMAKYIRSSCKF